MPANLEQIKRQIDQLNSQKDQIQQKIDMKNQELDRLNKQKEDLQKKITDLTGNVSENSDAAITTTTAGDISTDGGRANFAPKLMTYKRKKSESIDLLDMLINSLKG